MKVVIIDDLEFIRQTFCDVLELKGYQTEAFGSGEDFFGAEAFRNADCLLVDLRLPKMNGCEIIQRLRQEFCDVPVVLISGNLDTETLSSVSSYDNVTKLRKPCRIPEIFQAIETMVQQAS